MWSRSPPRTLQFSPHPRAAGRNPPRKNVLMYTHKWNIFNRQHFVLSWHVQLAITLSSHCPPLSHFFIASTSSVLPTPVAGDTTLMASQVFHRSNLRIFPDIQFPPVMYATCAKESASSFKMEITCGFISYVLQNLHIKQMHITYSGV
jgi:hypothetical protein